MQFNAKSIKQNVKEEVKIVPGKDCSAKGWEGSEDEGHNRKKNKAKKLKTDMKARLERSRQSARECRARKKLRYQYLEELVANREQAVLLLRQELEMYREWCKSIDEGNVPEAALKLLREKEEEDGCGDQELTLKN